MPRGRITQVPVPGSSGRTPTGAMQFEQDWPGLFVRGDDAIVLMTAIRQVEQVLKEKCRARLPDELAEIAEIIKHDVVYRSQDAPSPSEDQGTGA